MDFRFSRLYIAVYVVLLFFDDLSHQVVHSNGKTETRTCDPVHCVEEAVPAEWSSLPRLALPLDQMSFPELRSAGSSIIRFTLFRYLSCLLLNFLNRHMCGKTKFGSSQVPTFWSKQVNMKCLPRSANGIKLKLGNLEKICLEKVQPWSKMKPLKENPGNLMGMWAKSGHKALLVLVIEVGCAVIGEDPNDYVELESAPKAKKKKVSYSTEQRELMIADKDLMAQSDLLKAKILSENTLKSSSSSLKSSPSSSHVTSSYSTLKSSSSSSHVTPSLLKPANTKVSAKNVVQNLARTMKPFISEYRREQNKRLEDFGGCLQVTKIVSPMFENETFKLFLSDGELGIEARLSKDFSDFVLGGHLKQYDVIRVTKSSGHTSNNNLVIVGILDDFCFSILIIHLRTNYRVRGVSSLKRRE